MKKVLSYLLILFIASIGGVVGIGVYKVFEKKEVQTFDEKQKVFFTSLPEPVTDFPEGQLDFTYASAKSTPAVVHIKSLFEESVPANYFDPFRDFFGFPFYDDRNQQYQPRQKIQSGSGVIISEDGYIVTNNHVAEFATDIEIVLNDKRTFKAEVVGKDPTTDLALLKINEKNLPFLAFGNSDELKVGEWVLAVGNPFNLTSTVTAGIISAKARSINILDDKYRIESFIQTDAVVNPGNSGGALVNTRGDLVGINTAIQSQTGSYIGYSFAIPVNIVKKVMDDLLKFGEVQRGFIGISVKDMNAALAEEAGINHIMGVYVADLTEGGAAKSANIEIGDVITKIQDIEINSAPELQEQVGKYRPGDKIKVNLFSKGKEKVVDVVLLNKQGSTAIVKKEEVNTASVLGADILELTENEKIKMGLKNGVKINRISSGKLKAAGIQPGFIITHINKKPVSNPTDVTTALEANKGKIVGIEGIYPQDGTRYYYGFGL